MIPAGRRHLSNHIWLGLLGEVLKHDVIGSLQTGNQSANSLYSSRQILPPEAIIFTSQDGDQQRRSNGKFVWEPQNVQFRGGFHLRSHCCPDESKNSTWCVFLLFIWLIRRQKVVLKYMYVSEICLPQVNLFCFENVLFLSVPTSDLGKSPLNHLFSSQGRRH